MPIDMTERPTATFKQLMIEILGVKEWTNQCIIHGPSLLVSKRIVTLSPAAPKLTTSRRTGFTKLYVAFPALRITAKLC